VLNFTLSVGYTVKRLLITNGLDRRTWKKFQLKWNLISVTSVCLLMPPVLSMLRSGEQCTTMETVHRLVWSYCISIISGLKIVAILEGLLWGQFC
jgi:hypothetical protein